MFEFSLATKEDILYIHKIRNEKFPATTIFMIGKDKNKFVGYCGFILQEGQAEIIDAYIDNLYDNYVLQIICKAALNSIDLSGIKNIYCKNMSIRNLLENLKFEKINENLYHVNLEGYFKPCNCKH